MMVKLLSLYKSEDLKIGVAIASGIWSHGLLLILILLCEGNYSSVTASLSERLMRGNDCCFICNQNLECAGLETSNLKF